MDWLAAVGIPEQAMTRRQGVKSELRGGDIGEDKERTIQEIIFEPNELD